MSRLNKIFIQSNVCRFRNIFHPIKSLMQELISSISANTGISPAKATEVLQTVSDFIKEKYPLLAGTVDCVLDIATNNNSKHLS